MATAADYGDVWADIYDDYPAHPTAADAEPAADLIAALAAGQEVLEFGIGTGRIALPLAGRGVGVTGIDISPAMLDKLAGKPGADNIRVLVGDITTCRAPGRYGLVFGAFNTVLMVGDQDRQVDCFRNAAAHLRPGGRFVVEAFIPDFAKLAAPGGTTVRHVDDDGVWMLVTRHDPVLQTISSDTVRVGPGGVLRYPITLRYAWPPELDLMARLAGFGLRERYADWRRTPFTAAARNHVSVYQLDEPPTDGEQPWQA